MNEIMIADLFLLFSWGVMSIYTVRITHIVMQQRKEINKLKEEKQDSNVIHDVNLHDLLEYQNENKELKKENLMLRSELKFEDRKSLAWQS
ncbi:hypothetical protein SAMN02745116_01757 [Pilibacter termitis]|uniref:Uncharacterized protein n=1 Tax=Pilibacter termitis TaxID=263852 RepID=A0A1T4PCJ3_9ENTE|nr:hypothetical protein [Pilibacter termitis]SJZ89273.1 hypothetical protein SAMN02745116_01757 [Pilibacter termitis]